MTPSSPTAEIMELRADPSKQASQNKPHKPLPQQNQAGASLHAPVAHSSGLCKCTAQPLLSAEHEARFFIDEDHPLLGSQGEGGTRKRKD